MRCVCGCLAAFSLLLASACGTLPEAAPSAPGDAFEAELVAVDRLLQERLPRSALARLEALDPTGSPGAEARLAWLQARAAFAAEAYPRAAGACARLARLADGDPGWRPTCWEVALEAAPDRTVAASRVAEAIDALLARAPGDFRHLQAAYLGHLARRDQTARLALLARLAEAADDDAARAWVAATLADEALGAPSAATRRGLVRRLLALAPDHRQADEAVAWVLGEAEPVDLAAARALIGLAPGEIPSWRVALALAEWGLARGTRADPDTLDALLDAAEAGAAPATLVPPNETLDPASRAWLWARVAERLAVARARWLERQGAPLGAAAVLRAAPERDPPSATVPYLLGRLAERSGRDDAARARYLEALRAAPHPDAEARLAALVASEGFPGTPREWALAREPGPAFDDVTSTAGLADVAAGRVAWRDVDLDGDPDLLLDGRLFANDGRGRFAEVPLPPGPAATGGLLADVDGDGRVDLLLTGQANRLLLNRPGGAWRPRALPGGSGRRTEAAGFADIDRDGDLDLYLANYERGGTRRGLCHADQLLRNNGAGRFRDVTAEAGLELEQPLCGRGMTWADVDGDGRPDAVVGNYRLDPNLLWRNRGAGRFEEAGGRWGVRGTNQGGAFGHTIAVAAGDLDGDGREDLVLTNLAHPRFIAFSDRTRLLYTGAGTPPPLRDRRAAAGLHFAETESDAALGDVDNDGDLDLFVTAIYPGRWSRLYLNDGRGGLRDVSWSAGARVANGWGAAFADADGDGHLDLLVASRDGVRLLRNRGGDGHWLRVRIDDPGCQRAGVGATVRATSEGREQVRVVRIGRGTGSQDDLVVHFGLGARTGPVELAVENACGGTFGARLPGPDRRVTLHGPGTDRTVLSD